MKESTYLTRGNLIRSSEIMGEFNFLLYDSFFSKNFYDDHDFYKIRRFSLRICTIEKKKKMASYWEECLDNRRWDVQEKMLKITKKMLFWLWFSARIWAGRGMYNDNRLCKGNGICKLFLLQSRKMQLNQFKVKHTSLRSHWSIWEAIKRASLTFLNDF